jgi:hypothetical protein
MRWVQLIIGSEGLAADKNGEGEKQFFYCDILLKIVCCYSKPKSMNLDWF